MLSYVDVDGTLVIPQANAKWQTAPSNAGVATRGVVVLVGEADSGPAFSEDGDLSAATFGPSQLAQVLSKYSSGNLVDAYRNVVSPSKDPSIRGAPTQVICVKTNVGTKATASVAGVSGAFGTVQAKQSGSLGNLLYVSVSQVTAEVAPYITAAYAYLLAGETVRLSSNGGSPSMLVVTNATPSGFVSDNLSGLYAANVGVSGGVGTNPTLGLVGGGNVSVSSPAALTITVSITVDVWSTQPTVGGTLVVAAGKQISGAADVNAGSYVVTAVTSNTVTAVKVSEAGGGAPVAVGTVASVALTPASFGGTAYTPVTFTNRTGTLRFDTTAYVAAGDKTSGSFSGGVLTLTVETSGGVPTSWVTPPKVNDVAKVNLASGQVTYAFYQVTSVSANSCTLVALSGSGTLANWSHVLVTAGDWAFYRRSVDGLGKSLTAYRDPASVGAHFYGPTAAAAPVSVAGDFQVSSAEQRNSVNATRKSDGTSESHTVGGDVAVAFGKLGTLTVQATGSATMVAATGEGAVASGTATCAGVLAADTVTVNGVVFTAVTGAPAANQFDRSGTDAQTAANLAAAVNASVTAGVLHIYATASTNVAKLWSKTPGTGGNAYTLASSNGVRLAVSGATFAGGTAGSTLVVGGFTLTSVRHADYLVVSGATTAQGAPEVGPGTLFFDEGAGTAAQAVAGLVQVLNASGVASAAGVATASTGAVAAQVYLTAVAQGAAGNVVTLSKTGTLVSAISGATLSGGATGTATSPVVNDGTYLKGGVGGADWSVKLSDYKTIGDLAAFVSSRTNWTASAVAAFQSMSPSTLDRGTFEANENGNVSARPARVKQDAYDCAQALDVSSSVVQWLADPTAGIPEVQSSTFLSGGARGGTADSDVSAALAAAGLLRANFVVPLFSQDATADVSAGLTDPSSTYDVASVNAALSAHVAAFSQFKKRKPRQGFASFRGTFSAARSQAQSLGFFRVDCCFLDVQALGASGLQWFQPWMGSVLAAGMQSAGFYRPIFNKAIAAYGVRQNAGDFQVADDDAVEQALGAGLMVIRPRDDGSIAFVSDQTTYSADENFVYNSTQAVYVADVIAMTVALRMERAFVGQSFADVTAGAALSYLKGIMADLRRLKLIVSSDDAVEGYRNAKVQISPPSMLVSAEVKEATGIYFVPIRFLITQTVQSAQQG